MDEETTMLCSTPRIRPGECKWIVQNETTWLFTGLSTCVIHLTDDIGCYQYHDHVSKDLALQFNQSTNTVTLMYLSPKIGGWIPRSTDPREVRLGLSPMQPSSVDSAE